jgi:hypothetical protein
VRISCDLSSLSWQDMMTHSVTVLPSANGGDFDGNVYITLECANGETNEVQLLQYDGTAPAFASGQPVSVTARTYDMGAVQTVKV